jgi:hypothetical protein
MNPGFPEAPRGTDPQATRSAYLFAREQVAAHRSDHYNAVRAMRRWPAHDARGGRPDADSSNRGR